MLPLRVASGAAKPSSRPIRFHPRALVAPLACDLARGKLGWKPVEEPEELLDEAVRVHRRSR